METYPIYFWIVLLSKIKTFFSKMFDFHNNPRRIGQKQNRQGKYLVTLITIRLLTSSCTSLVLLYLPIGLFNNFISIPPHSSSFFLFSSIQISFPFRLDVISRDRFQPTNRVYSKRSWENARESS